MGRSWRGGTLLGLLAALAALAALAPATADDSNKRVVCYYTNWSVYRPGTAKFSPQNINPYLCTHLIYAFGGLTRENGIRAYDKYQDIEQGGYAKFTGLKSYNKQLKTMLAIGGWNEGSARFSPMVADPERRAEFVKNAVRFLRTNHFDGLDLDWEYPAYRDGGKPADRDNYAALVQELREEFDKESKKTGRPRLLLTMAVPAGIEYIDKGYDVPRLNKYLDFMNILSYDYHSAFESAVNHHSPLYPIGEDDEYNFEAALSIDYTIKHYVKLGASRDKLVLGIPTYGRSYTLFNPDSSELGAPSDGPGEQGDATREKGYLAYYEICEAEGWEVQKPHPKAMGPYAVKGNQWVGYDDTEIVKLKAEYVNEKGLGGIMFWSIDNDDFRGKCHNRPYPLIEAAKEALLDVKSGNEKNLISSKTSKNKSSHRANDNSAARSESSSSSTPRRTNKLKTKAPASTRRTTAATTPSTSTTGHGLTTPEPPSTPDPGSDFVCKDEGFFPHPRDCKKYFWCLDSGPSNLGIVAHQFTCPSGLFFNKAADSCDYARNVICKKPAAAAATTAAASTTAATPAVSAGRTTTSTTTTTTTEAPVEEEEEEEEEEIDDVEDGGQEDPEALKELLNLIKKLGGVEELEKQLRGGSSGAAESPAASPSSGTTNNHLSRNRSLVERVLQGRSRHAATLSTAPASDATTPRYKSLFRNGPSRPQNDGLQDAKDTRKDRERPKYVSIRRERPTVAAELEEAVQNEPEETAVEARTRSRYDKPAKREDDRDDDDEEVVQDERRPTKPATPEYITLRRNRPIDEPAVTTSRYVTLQRGRPSSTTEAAALSPQDKEEDDEEVESTSSEEDAGAVAVVTPSPSVAPYREGPVYRPTPLRTTRPADDEEETTVITTTPTTTTTATPKVSGERVSLRRPGGFLNHGSRGRRPTTQAPATTTSTTAAPRRTPPRVIRRRKPVATTASPVDSDGAAQTSAQTAAPSRESVVNRGQSAAVAQRRRKFRPDVKTTTYSPRDEEATATTLSEATTERGRFSFPRRRPAGKSEAGGATTAAPSSAEQAASVTATTATAPGTPLQGRELNALLARALQEQQLQDDRVQEQQDLNEADLSDLTHPAVVAIHTLATQAAATPPLASTPSPFVAASSPALPQSSAFTHVRTGDSTFSTSLTFPDAANAIQHVQPPPAAPRQPPRQHHTAVSTIGLTDGGPATSALTTPLPLLEIRVPLMTTRGRGGAARRLPQGNPQGGLGLGADDVPRLRSPNPQLGPLTPLTGQLGPLAPLGQDYEYYDDEADTAPSATKVKIHGDGWIECLDRGNFPHPFSCRKFISCAKMESGGLQGWEYTCPRGLSFDPIGGICNWSAGLGCKA